MGRYRKVDPRMWGDAKFRALSRPKPCGQSLWIYFLTGPETTSLPGVLVGGPAHFAEALGWTVKDFMKAFDEVSRQGIVKADWDARLVWLPNGIKYNQPESPNVVRSWKDHWDNVPECSLKAAIYKSAQGFCEALGKAFAEAFAEACRQPSPNQEQEQEQDQEQISDFCSERSADAAPRSEPQAADDPPKSGKVPVDERHANDADSSDEGGMQTRKADAPPARKTGAPGTAGKGRPQDIDPLLLSEHERAAHAAIVGDESLRPIVRCPATLARDLCAAGPGVDVAREVRRAGGWLRANPTKAKKNGARFLLGWVSREQERGGATRLPFGGPRLVKVQQDPSWEFNREANAARLAANHATAAAKGEF